MKKNKACIEELSHVNIDDADTRSEWPLIEKPLGAVTYEHCLTERFYGDVIIATAERNYYVDRYHELCLCAHYNRRIPGEYKFKEGYQLFVTKKRMCLDIYWNLGNISDESMIVEYYTSMSDAAASIHYKDFCDLQRMIEEGIMWEKTHIIDPFQFTGGSYFQSAADKNGKSKYTIHEIPIVESREMVQFYMNNENETWEMMSVSPEPIGNLMRFFKDFDDLDERELHLRKFIPLMTAIAENEFYKKAFDTVKKSYESRKNVVYY